MKKTPPQSIDEAPYARIPARAELHVRAELVSEGRAWMVRLVRELRHDGEPQSGGTVWRRTFRTRASADATFAVLQGGGRTLTAWAEMALVLPPGGVDAAIDRALAVRRGEPDVAGGAASRASGTAPSTRRDDERVYSHVVTSSGSPRVELTRMPPARPFLVIRFEADWQRDRFWDWMKWQRARFKEFEALVGVIGEEPVRRELLNEMLDTERAVKRRGRAAGGRRPLLFWRGDL